MPADEKERRPTPTFQESAKKFKPGPVAPPETEEGRADMSGAPREAERLPDHERRAAAMRERAGAGTDDEMSNGAPGKLRKMPGERGRR